MVWHLFDLDWTLECNKQVKIAEVGRVIQIFWWIKIHQRKEKDKKIRRSIINQTSSKIKQVSRIEVKKMQSYSIKIIIDKVRRTAKGNHQVVFIVQQMPKINGVDWKINRI